jgi:membrane-associated protease RseP (regulator of RpoE activity)
MNDGTRDPRPGSPFSSPLIELVPSPQGERNVYAPVFRRPDRPHYGRALLLFALTFLTTTTLGPVMMLWSRTDLTTDLVPWLLPYVAKGVWSDPRLIRAGFAFSIPALTILMCHELGHYIACRIYRIPCTPPYFLPVPFNFGTFGAFIRIKAPIHSKRQLFDVGIAGPIAGFVALIPFLLYGVAKSRPGTLAHGAGTVLLPGRCLAIELVSRLFHGPLAKGAVLNLHPTALAAWLGLLATSINLLPLGQLDGGHILYSATGPFQRRVALPLWLALALLGFYWPGWWLWCVILLVIGLYHPPVFDESIPLDGKRRLLAWLALAMLVLSFMPVPISEIG